MSLIVNGTEIEDLIVVSRTLGRTIEIEKLQDQNGNIIWEKSTIPQVMLMPMNGNIAGYNQLSSGTVDATVVYYEYSRDTGDFVQVQLAEGASVIGYYTKAAGPFSHYMVWGCAEVSANIFGSEEIKIPARYKGLPVSGIVANAFSGDTRLKKVTIAEGVEFIGKQAFENCSNLQTLSIPESVASFWFDMLDGTPLFNNSTNWINDVLTISNKQIQAKSSVTTANIGEDITGIAIECYSLCQLTTINFNSNNIAQVDIDRLSTRSATTNYIIYNEAGDKVVVSGKSMDRKLGYFSTNDENRSYPTTILNLGSNVKTLPTGILISGSIFTPSSSSSGPMKVGGIKPTPSMLQNYTNITHLAPYCMLCASQNTSMLMATTKDNPFVIPSRITEVDPYALAGGAGECAIEYVRIECNVLSEGMFAAEILGGGSSALNSHLKGFEITGSPTIIPQKCFFGCYQLTEINIPSSVTEIGPKSFSPNTTPKFTKIVFNQPSGVQVEFPTAGSGYGAFYYKSAYSVSIYTDNESVKNYDWASDNVTATFYHLDGTAWE